MAPSNSILISAGPRMSHIPYIMSTDIARDYRIDFLIGLYPTRYLQYALQLILPRNKYLKFMARLQRENDYSFSISLNILGEIFSHLMSYCKSARYPRHITNAFAYASAFAFSRQASRLLNTKGYSIYHYRCSYGLSSLEIASKRGVIKLCDHSIAHPSLNFHLCLNQGSFPSSPSAVSSSTSGD
jgi:hypothetical protein